MTSFYSPFQVRGIGDVNTKTVEGTLAVFASSFVAQIVVYYNIFGLDVSTNFFTFHPLLGLVTKAFSSKHLDFGTIRKRILNKWLNQKC